MRVGDLMVGGEPWVHIEVNGLTAHGRAHPELELSLALHSSEHRRVELRYVVVGLFVDDLMLGEGVLVNQDVHPEGTPVVVRVVASSSTLTQAAERLHDASTLAVELRWRGRLRGRAHPAEPGTEAWTEQQLTEPQEVQTWTVPRDSWRAQIAQPTGTNVQPGVPRVRRVLGTPGRWLAGIAVTAAAGLVLQLFTGIFGSWLHPAAAEDRLRPGPDIAIQTDLVYLDDEGRSLAMPGDFRPGPDLARQMAQPGAAANEQVLGALRAAGGVRVGKLSLRILAQGQRHQQIRILRIRPVNLRRTAPLAGTLFNLPPQEGSPTMKMMFDLDEVNPVARAVIVDEQNVRVRPGGDFFADQTITLQDGEQQVILLRAATSRFNAAFDLQIDYVVGTTRKTRIISDRGRPFQVTAPPCGPASGPYAYGRAFELQGDFSIVPDPNPQIHSAPGCTIPARR